MPPEPVSPCISICELDPAGGLCKGCLRTIDEIAGWGALDRQGRLLVLQAVARRRDAVFEPLPDVADAGARPTSTEPRS